MPTRRRGPRDWRRPLLHSVVLLLLIVCMYWKLVLTRQYTWLNQQDAAGLLLPWMQLQAGELHRWSLALWDPYQWCGQPLIGQGQAGTAYPFNWLLWAMPLRHGWLRHVFLNWYLVLIHFQAAGFMFWLCRDLGRSVAASLLAGLAFSVGAFLGASEWPAALNAALWAPLAFLFFFRADRGYRASASAALCGGALGFSWLSGDPQVPLLLSLVFAGLWLWHAWTSRNWRPPALFAAAALGVSALQCLPALEYLAQSPASWWTYPLAQWNAHAVAPMALPGVVIPQLFPDSMLYTGWTVLGLAVLGLLTEYRSKHVRLLAALSIGGIFICLGRYASFEGILYGLRGLAREPKAALVLFGLGAAVLSAFGLDACRRREAAALHAASRVAMALVAIAALGCFALLLLSMTNGNEYKQFTPLALCTIAAMLAAGLFEGWRRGAIGPQAASVLALLLAMWEFGNVTGFQWVNVEYGWGSLSQLANSADAVQFLNTENTPVRVDSAALPYHFGDWTGVEHFSGISGGTENVVHASGFPAARALAGVNFSVGPSPVHPGQPPVFDSPRGLKVFRNPDAAPRAFVVHRAVSAQTAGEKDALLAHSVTALREEAFVSGAAPRLEACTGLEPATVLWRKSRAVRVKAALTCTGLLVLGQTWYPGWKVAVDGKPGHLYEVYGFLQGAVVPAGVHEVTFTYSPISVWAGGAITFLSLAALGAVAFRRSGLPS